MTHWIPISQWIAEAILIPVAAVFDRIHGKPRPCLGIIEPRLGEVDIQRGIKYVTGVRCIYIVSMVFVQQFIRAYRHTPGIISQLREAVAVGLGIVPGVALHILMDIQCTLARIRRWTDQ